MMATPDKLRRMTLLKNAAESTPLRRRSTSIAQSPIVLLEKYNDESERSARRSNVDLQRRVSSIPTPSDSMNESFKFVCEQEMKEHLQICSKLFTENKINSKNVWKLQIIDLLKQLSQKTTGDNLQVASTSLDISAKVYGIRVDDVHAECLKLASNMARVADKEPPSIDDEGNDEVAAQNGEPQKKKKKKRRLSATVKSSIAKDPNSLLAPLPKLESVFFSTRTVAEASAVDNLVTNTLKINNSGYKFLLLSDAKAWPGEDEPKDQKPFSPKIPQISNLPLCAPFNDFELDQWDPDEEAKQLAENSEIQTGNEVLVDNNGLPIAELDGSIHDIFSNNDNDNDIEEEMEVQEAQINENVARIVDCIPSGTIQRSEYSYNSIVSNHNGQIIDQIWAGPSHWKLKFIRRPLVRFSGQVATEKVEKHAKKRPLVELDFTEWEGVQIKKINTKKKMGLIDSNKITLPVLDAYCESTPDCLSELILKSSLKIQTRNEVESEPDYELKEYNYENPNDSQYCSQQNGDIFDGDDGGDACDNDIVFEENVVAAEKQFLGENLVDAPETVTKSSVPYALQAKKMDMKKLKAFVWKSLTKAKETVDVNAMERGGDVVPTTFSKMYKELPLCLTEKMKQDLSCPLAFVALLHLCNEQNLLLKQLPGYKDFSIEGPKN